MAARSEGQRVWEAETRILQFEDEYETATVGRTRCCCCAAAMHCLRWQRCSAGAAAASTRCAGCQMARACWPGTIRPAVQRELPCHAC